MRKASFTICNKWSADIIYLPVMTPISSKLTSIADLLNLLKGIWSLSVSVQNVCPQALKRSCIHGIQVYTKFSKRLAPTSVLDVPSDSNVSSTFNIEDLTHYRGYD
eukprot:TRINITY_DN17041_c0_g1_i1.p2 TRINITY_DN17041_c0_g1~~TRINITY_DN17041_c0_g1_i1.p2  ORF type:complete len:106 (+),score=3.59 TRINITY_DN17041_c0_g1_i1:160-477(+)